MNWKKRYKDLESSWDAHKAAETARYNKLDADWAEKYAALYDASRSRLETIAIAASAIAEGKEVMVVVDGDDVYALAGGGDD